MNLALLMASSMLAQNVEGLLKHFDKQARVGLANQFFAELRKAEFIDEDIKFASNTPADSLQQKVWFWAAEWLYAQNQFKQAESYALKALPKYHPSNPDKSDCLNTLGCSYMRLSDFKRAAHYSKQSLEIDLRLGDNDRISSSLNTLTAIYMAAYQPKEAEKHILRALQYADKVHNPGRKAILMGMASEVYHALGNDTIALRYAEQAYAMEQQLGRKPKMMIRLSQKAAALIGLRRYKEAEAVLRICIPALREMGELHSVGIDLNKMGMALSEQDRSREAIPYYKEAAALFAKMGDLYNEIHSHQGLYECYWTINPDSAKIALDRFNLLKDSLYSKSSAEALSRYNAEFGNHQLQAENEATRKMHRYTLIIGASLILLILLAVGYTIRRNTRRHRQQIQKLVCEVEQLRSSSVEEKTPNAMPSKSARREVSRVADIATEKVEEETEKTAPPLVEALETPELTTTDEDRLFLIQVIEAVNVIMPQGIPSVDAVASELNMSVSTFRRRIQIAANESPKSYILAIQMERAALLLTDHPNIAISQVANLCGFDETSSFCHTFKRVYGCSPSKYREMM